MSCMNNQGTRTCHSPRPKAVGGTVALAVLTLGVAAFSQPLRRPPASRQRMTVARQDGAQAPQVREDEKAEEPKTPREIAAQLVPILARKKTPSQLYLSYQRLFNDFAAQEKARPVTTQQALVYRDRLAQHLRKMGDVLGEMADHAKVRKDIQRGTSSVPPEDRQTTFSESGRQLDRLLSQFVTMGRALPKTRQAAVARPVPPQPERR